MQEEKKRRKLEEEQEKEKKRHERKIRKEEKQFAERKRQRTKSLNKEPFPKQKKILKTGPGKLNVISVGSSSQLVIKEPENNVGTSGNEKPILGMC